MSDHEISNTGIIYKLDDKLPLLQSIFVALQHFLAIFIPLLTPIVIICSALKLDSQTSSYIISVTLIFSGIGTFIQARRFGKVGSGLLSIQGASANFIVPLIMIGKIGGLPLIFGMCIIGSCVQILASYALKFTKYLFPPVVTGTLVIIIGITLIKFAIIDCAGGELAKQTGTFASLQNLLLAGMVILVILMLNLSNNKYLRLSSIFIGVVTGYLFAFFMGELHYHSILLQIKQTSVFCFPIPFRFGIRFKIDYIIPMILFYLITVMESIGDLTVTAMLSHEPVSGDKYIKRLAGGVLGEGLNSILTAVFGGVPLTTFSQNNGVIQITGVASKYIAYFVAAILVLFGFVPSFGIVFSLMPKPVLGGAMLIMFSMIAVYGIKIIFNAKLDHKAALIIGLSFGTGFGVTFYPEIMQHLPPIAKNIFSSGITTGGLTAAFLNLILQKTY